MTKYLFYRQFFATFFYINITFFLLQVVYILSKESTYIDALSYPFTVYAELFYAFILQTILYLLLSIFQTELLWGVKTFFKDKIDTIRWQYIICTATIVALLSVNCFFFPLSKLSRIFLPELPLILLNISVVSSLSLLGGLMTLAIGNYIKTYPLRTCLLLLGCFLIFLFPKTSIKVQQNQQTNLIIIGIDSLSPEQITPNRTPFLYKYLQTSVHFENTISPLARTYSAWTTILTGLYPLHHNARENLYPRHLIKSSASFAWILQKQGYQTLFATDDRRFNNLGKEFGFQEIIGPRIGVNDVLLGSFYDFPLSNIIINWSMSKWLLPYNYINRAGHFSYYPFSFDQALQQKIEQINPKQPVFMAIHFTLPHWPYAWANSSPATVNNEYSVDAREELYYQAVTGADKQAQQVFYQLDKKGILSNSMVIVLSDHGEVLYKKGSRRTNPLLYQGISPGPFEIYLKTKMNNELDKSVGHGSDLLSPSQFHCILGFKLFKKNVLETKAKTISTRVSLLDIAPTIAEFFHFSLTQLDGISLLPTIENKSLPPENRLFFLESGMAPNQILTEKKVVALAHEIFQINNKNLLIEVKTEKFQTINAMKLYGVIQNQWLIALYPNDNKYITVFLNLETGEWSDNPHANFIKTTPFTALLTNLRTFYKENLANYPYLNL